MPITKIKKDVKLHKSNPSSEFKDRKRVGLALLECLENNDPEAFVEVLDAYLHVNRTQIAQRSNLARSTVQQALSKKGNPTLKTVAKIVHEAVG